MASHSHDHQNCIDTALERAEAVCSERKLRLTPLRRSVLELVWGGHEPVGAYELLASLAAQGRSASPPTVYRALDFLMEAGLVHRLDSLNAYVGCETPGERHQSAFLICRGCRNVTEIGMASVQREIELAAAESGFKTENHMLEVQGLCQACEDVPEQ